MGPKPPKPPKPPKAPKPVKDPNRPLTGLAKFGLFMAAHWRGVLVILTPLICVVILVFKMPPGVDQWCAYTLAVMAVFWVTEAVPLPVTSFLPVLIFPLSGVSTTEEVVASYFNDTVLMFLGSLILAYSIEQCGLHRRLALAIIRVVGYTHNRLLFAMTITTWFVSFWITNTAATTMMTPINFAVLEVFEKKKILKIFETTSTGESVASEITVCYFCSATFSATIGGIGTLVGTGTNLAFKGLFVTNYPKAPELLSFPMFSAFTVPYCLILQLCLYSSMSLIYFGTFRPNSKSAQKTKMTPELKAEVKKAILEESKKLGKITYWEINTGIIFVLGMLGFFLRSPQIFTGWGDKILQNFNIKDIKYIRDSAWAYLVSVIFLLLPFRLEFFKYFTKSKKTACVRRTTRSLLDWNITEATMPFSFAFLLGGGFALSDGAKKGLTEQMGTFLSQLRVLPGPVIQLLLIIFTIFVTNFASNVAVANVICPVAMSLAEKIGENPLRYVLISGICASYCFMLPVGTPGNLIVQSAAKVNTYSMIKAGLPITIITILITFVAMLVWAPVIFPVMKEMPSWIELDRKKT